MYAVIETGGKQYRVNQGDIIDVERLPGAAEGDDVVFERVLMIGGDDAADVKIGTPVVEGARVTATLVDDDLRGPKLVVFKKKRRKGYRRTRGHRQDLHRVRISNIEL